MNEKKLTDYSIENILENFSRENISKISTEHIPTGFPRLDELLGGGLTAGTIMLGAHSSMGKSTLALQMAQNISAQGIPVFYYSMEMRKVNIVAKALSREVFVQSDHQKSISGNDLLSAKRRQTFDEDTWELIEDARQIVKEEARNLYIVEDLEAASVSGLSIYEDVTKLAEKGNAVVFVDYLQIIAAEVRDESGRRQPYAGDIRTAVDQNVKLLRRLANEMAIPVVIINSMNRGSYGKTISASAFKESGSIEYTADVVLALQFSVFREKVIEKNGELLCDAEKTRNPRQIDLIVLKQRYGQCGLDAYAAFQYYAGNDYFEELPVKSDAQGETQNAAETAAPDMKMNFSVVKAEENPIVSVVEAENTRENIVEEGTEADTLESTVKSDRKSRSFSLKVHAVVEDTELDAGSEEKQESLELKPKVEENQNVSELELEPGDAIQFSDAGEEHEDKWSTSDPDEEKSEDKESTSDSDEEKTEEKNQSMEWSEYDCDWLDDCEEGE